MTFGRSRRFRLMTIWSGTGKEPWERDMTQATTQASITSQTITVEHIRISSELSFAEVRRKLEGTVPKLDIGIAEARSRRRFLRAASTIRPWCAF